MKLKLPEKLKHMSIRTKRILALSVCLVLLGAAIVQNVLSGSATSQKPGQDISSSNGENSELIGVSKIEDSEEYFAQRRLERLKDQSALSEEYQMIVEDKEAAADAVTEAQYMIETLNTLMSCESDLESQIKALGYRDVFASLELTGEVDITVLAESLNEADVNTIAGIVTEMMDVSPDRITVRGVVSSISVS